MVSLSQVLPESGIKLASPVPPRPAMARVVLQILPEPARAPVPRVLSKPAMERVSPACRELGLALFHQMA